MTTSTFSIPGTSWLVPERVPDDPFYWPRRPLYTPLDMTNPPPLPLDRDIGPQQPRFALLLNPFYPKDPHGSYGKHVLTPSLALTSIAGATPANWAVKYWDENLLQGPIPLEEFPSVVGITVHLTFAKRAYLLADWLRLRGARVVLGGLHVHSCPDEAAGHADGIAIGDGVQLWPRILRDAELGKVQRRYHAPFKGSFNDDPPVRRDLLDRANYLTSTSVIATRGCSNRCGFCYLSTSGLQMPYRARSVELVRDEIVSEGQGYVVFTDNNLGADRDYLKALCAVLRPLRIIWSAAVTLDVTDDPELVCAMARCGCTGVFIGFETLTDQNLVDARKRGPRTEEFARRVGIFHEHGIAVNGSFVLGFDHDGKDVFARTEQWIESTRLECATFHILTPYPGTPLFRQLEREGRLLHRDWSLYDTGHVVFQPRHMSAEELALGYDWLYRRLFSSGSIWRRRPRAAGQVLPYLVMCYMYKRSNRAWRWLIKHRLVRAVWAPLLLLKLHLRRREDQLGFREALHPHPSRAAVCAE